jgi:hypothetical protein
MRKLLGERPMTSAERTARHRARVKAAAEAELSVPAASPDRPSPVLVWPPYGDDPLPSRAEALALPPQAFRGWFLFIQCERCGETRIAANEGRTPWRSMRLVYILRRMRHAGCGGEPSRVELLSGIEGLSSRPVRRIVLRGGG